jgi:protein-disulfide isomerase
LVEALNTRAYKAAVDGDWMLSHHLGITAVPTFRLKGEVLVGAQPYDALAAFAAANGIARRTAV